MSRRAVADIVGPPDLQTTSVFTRFFFLTGSTISSGSPPDAENSPLDQPSHSRGIPQDASSPALTGQAKSVTTGDMALAIPVRGHPCTEDQPDQQSYKGSRERAPAGDQQTKGGGRKRASAGGSRGLPLSSSIKKMAASPAGSSSSTIIAASPAGSSRLQSPGVQIQRWTSDVVLPRSREGGSAVKELDLLDLGLVCESGRTLAEITAGSALDAAPALLGWTLLHHGVGGRIVEVEAYSQEDLASHSSRGMTFRTRAMFGPPGHLYIYRSYGCHWCANITCGPPGVGAGVLLRALEPTHGMEAMRERRSGVGDRLLCCGPGRLAQALGLDDSVYGADLGLAPFAASPPPENISYEATPRIGISRAQELPWRFVEHRSPWVSRAR